MAAPVTKKIGELTFVIGHIPAMKAPRAFKQLIRVAGPLISELTALLKDGTGQEEIMSALTGGKLNSLITRAMEVDDESMLALMLELAEATKVIGQATSLRQSFDLTFTGNLDLMIQWFIEAAKVNFGSFWKSAETSER